MMTKEQEAHLNSVVQFATEALIQKYTLGAIEHKGLITDLSTEVLLQEALNEALDQVVYLTTLIQKIKGSSTDTQ